MKRKIVWASQHLEIDSTTGSLENPEDDEDFDEEYFEDGENYMMSKMQTQKVMSTPFGLWRIDDVMNPYKQFKLWMGHTNFTISVNVAKTIKNVPGVEVLSILTRYRFLVGVGELFDIRDVRVNIEKLLKCSGCDIDNAELKQKIEELKETLSEYDKWAIYVFPNGNIDFVTNEVGSKLFKEKLLLFQNAVDHSSGILIENTDD